MQSAGCMKLHMDGARLFHAEVATAVPASAYASRATTVMCCLSKGLCAPVGSLLAGPTDALTLLKFAQRCGVSASLRAMGAQGMQAVRMVMHTEPTDQLTAVAQYRLRHDDCNVVGVHLFSFGAAAKSAAWMNGVITAQRGAGR